MVLIDNSSYDEEMLNQYDHSKRDRSPSPDSSNKRQAFASFYNAFSAAIKDQPKKVHQDDLPPPPESWEEMLNHPYKTEFMQAADVEFQKLEKMNAWTPVKRKTIEEDHKTCKWSTKPHRCPRHQILPLRWVFTYKVDENGYLAKFKARICVRGDLQVNREATRFIGIRITRDRATKRLWISQDAYIEKIAHRFHITPLKPVKTPFSPSSLPAPPSDYQAPLAMIHLYQQKIGSLLYATIITRPDAAKASQMLSEYLTNPTEQHMDAADKAIAYLYHTRYKAIEYSPIQSDGPTFVCASDASYADNIGRKSSEGYIAYLFNGPIDWIAKKQKTVTTSTTEAELLAISSASKHVMWWKRLFRSIKLDLEQRLNVLCDNKQTVDLLTKVNSLFRTKLRHIDIHHHWLRQEIVAGNIDIAWIETNSMPADGLTKPLPYQKHQRFIDHLNMVDIHDRIVEI
ncbi:hypothetical protein N7523_010517 [Penicillium sp. IBT 18751x]|nr:hypothetical protein N7523_010517 [Penicillium sp. IBT 18751x]